VKDVTIKVYQFNELNKEAQDKVVSDYERYLDFESDVVTDDFIVDIEKRTGIHITRTYYDLSCSQGSGSNFAFTVPEQNVLKFAEFFANFDIIDLLEDADLYIQTISNSYASRYCHAYVRDIDIAVENYDLTDDTNKFEEMVDKFREQITDWYRLQCTILHTELRRYYADCISRESVAENCEVNDYWFYEDGSICSA